MVLFTDFPVHLKTISLPGWQSVKTAQKPWSAGTGLNVANGPFTRLYLQGLEESDLYNVTEYTEGHESAVSTHYGDELMNLGLITSDASSGQYMDGRRESCDFDSRLFYVQKQAE